MFIFAIMCAIPIIASIPTIPSCLPSSADLLEPVIRQLSSSKPPALDCAWSTFIKVSRMAVPEYGFHNLNKLWNATGRCPQRAPYQSRSLAKIQTQLFLELLLRKPFVIVNRKIWDMNTFVCWNFMNGTSNVLNLSAGNLCNLRSQNRTASRPHSFFYCRSVAWLTSFGRRRPTHAWNHDCGLFFFDWVAHEVCGKECCQNRCWNLILAMAADPASRIYLLLCSPAVRYRLLDRALRYT